MTNEEERMLYDDILKAIEHFHEALDEIKKAQLIFLSVGKRLENRQPVELSGPCNDL